MKAFTVTILDETAKAIEAHIESTQDWLQHALDNKGRQCEDKVIQEFSDKQPKKLSSVQRKEILKSLEFESYSDERQNKDLKDRLKLKP